MPTTTPGRRERRKAQTRARLLGAARDLLAAGGPDAVRIADVTDRADVGFGTFYSYFETKSALLEAVVADVLDATAAAIGAQALASEDPAAAVALAYNRFLAFGAENAGLATVLAGLPDADARFEASLAEPARQSLQRGVDAGRFDIEDVDVALTSIAAGALAVIRGIATGRLDERAAAHGTVMLLRGLGVPDAEARALAQAAQ